MSVTEGQRLDCCKEGNRIPCERNGGYTMSVWNRKKMWANRVLAVGMSLAVAVSMLPAGSPAISKAAEEKEVTADAVQNDAGNYELMNQVQGSNILHCWNWSYATIEAHLPLIAECGFTAVQTSPAQQPKDYNYSYTDEKTGETISGTGDSPEGSAVGWPGKGGTGNWWKLYQPVTFNVCDNGNTWLGTKAKLTSLCDTAEQYGIKVIVDVVANHMGNIKGWQNSLSDISPQVGEYWNPDMMTDTSYWHINDLQIWMSDGREHFTQGTMGMPDLNTANKTVQKYVYDYLDECIDCGVDGFRFDAAKHIETPDDSSSFASDFWPTVLDEAKSHYKAKTGGELFVYGEILNTVGDNFSIDSYTKYMSVTDNSAGHHLLESIRNNQAAVPNLKYAANKAVIWAESHDTFMNESSRYASDRSIVKSWALAGNKKDAASLFFVRPYYSKDTLLNDKDGSFNDNMSKTVEPAQMGICNTYVWASKEVAAINHFNNRFAGSEDVSGTSGDIAYCKRGNGIILVNMPGAGEVSTSAHGLADGSYVDEVSGNTFKVSGGNISGNITSEYGVAVIYNNVMSNPSTSYPITVDKPQISTTLGNGQITGAKEITYTVKNANSATYSIDGGAETAFEGSVTLEVGAGLSVGDTTTVKITAKGDKGTSTQTYTYTMSENVPILSISPDDGETFADQLEVTVTAENTETATYQIGSKTEEAFSGTKTITIGEDMEDGDTVTITVSGKSSNGKEATVRATYTKEEADTSTNIYFKNTNGWSNVNCYAWNGESDANGEWPGVAMTLYDKENNIYVLNLGKEYKKVIFNNGADQTDDLICEGLGYLYDMGTGKWTQYASAKPKVKASKGTGNITSATKVTYTVTDAQTASYCVDGGEEVEFQDSVTITVGEGLISGQSQTVEIKAVNGSETVTKTYTYTMQQYSGSTATPGAGEKTEGPVDTETPGTATSTPKVPGMEGDAEEATPTLVPTNKVTASAPVYHTMVPAETRRPGQTEIPTQTGQVSVTPTAAPTGAPSRTDQPSVTIAPTATATATVKPSVTPDPFSKDDSWDDEDQFDNITVITERLKVRSVKVSRMTVKRGNRIRFTVKASGGKKSYRYGFVVYRSNGTKVRSSGYLPKSSWIWKTTKKGTYKVKVVIKDGKGNTASKTVKKIRVK